MAAWERSWSLVGSPAALHKDEKSQITVCLAYGTQLGDLSAQRIVASKTWRVHPTLPARNQRDPRIKLVADVDQRLNPGDVNAPWMLFP